MKSFLIAFCILVLISMIGVTTWASLDRSVIDGFKSVWADRWGAATLFDAYFAFLTFYLWVFYKESSILARTLWLLAILAFGNIAMAIYLLKEIYHLPKGATVPSLLLRKERA